MGTRRSRTLREIERVLSERIMALPTFVAGCGPFPRGEGRWTNEPAALAPGERNAAASLYLALMTAETLMLVGAAGPTIVEGPFARNEIFGGALAAITGRPVEPSDAGTGTTLGTLMTATGVLPKRPEARNVAPLPDPALSSYVEAWRAAARSE